MFVLDGKDESGRYLVRDTSDGVIEPYTRKQLEDIVRTRGIGILGISYDYKNGKCDFRTMEGRYFPSLEWLAECRLIPILRREGVRVDCCDTYVDEERLKFGIRFLGGFLAWSGDEDLCDTSTLDSSVKKLLRSACFRFNEDTGIRVSFHTGEKAWTYFEFS